MKARVRIRPFRFNGHCICATADGVLHHEEFLADGAADPRRRFAETLIDALAAPTIRSSSIRLRKDKAEGTGGGISRSRRSARTTIARLADLLPIVRGAVYLREFQFSNSIKSVAPALCPGFGYDDLDGVADGLAASAPSFNSPPARSRPPRLGQVARSAARLLRARHARHGRSAPRADAFGGSGTRLGQRRLW